MRNTQCKNWAKQRIQKSDKYQLKAFNEVNNLIVSKRNGKRIELSDGTKLIEFMSCSYLGLDQDKRIIQAASNHLNELGVNFAVARTRLRSAPSVTLENLLNQIFKCHCVTFTSLHLVHLGMLPLIASGGLPSYPIADDGIVFILDKRAHASIQIERSLMQQFGEVVLVDFSDLDKIEDAFKFSHDSCRTPLALADGVCSMGGLIPVKELIAFADRYNGYIYLDDAHGISIHGHNGCGYVLDQIGFFHPRLFLAISLSKAYGTNGAAIGVATIEDEIIIRRYANPYLFSNPMPLSIVSSAIASAEIHLTSEIYSLQNKLLDNIRYFDSLTESGGLKDRIINLSSTSPIRGIKIGDEFQDIQITKKLRTMGIGVTPAIYPTVAEGESILRVAISADHSKEDILYLKDCLELC